jgi:hypothetical protein
MRFALVLVAGLATLGASAFTSVPAKADPYRWCAEYGSSHGGRNCGFVTLSQCRAAIMGDNRATCTLNPYFTGRPLRTW